MIYQITEAQRLEAMDALYLLSMKTEEMLRQKDKAYVMLQSLAHVDTEPVAWYDKEMNSAYTRVELDGGTEEGLQPLYRHPAPLRELSDADIDAAWRSVDYTQPYDDFRIAVARAILKKAGEK